MTEVALLDGDIEKERYRTLRAEIQVELDALPLEQIPAQLSEDEALRRLDEVVKLIKNYQDKDSAEVNLILRNIMEAIFVKDGKIVRYKPRAWCANLFPNDGKVPEET